jgi:hypothetical protein
MSIRDPSEYLLPAVIAAITAADLEAEDEAMIKIARHLAIVVDQAPAARREYCARWVVPELVRVLAELGCSPASRSRIKGGAPPDAIDSPLRRLRTVPL